MLGKLSADGSPTAALMAVSAVLCVVTLLNGFWPTAANALQFVVSGSSVFLGLLFLGSSLAALRLAPSLSTGGSMAFRLVSLAGALGLGGILAVSIVQTDAAVRLLDAALLAAGVPFVFLCKRAHTPDERILIVEGEGRSMERRPLIYQRSDKLS
jgi:L-asparagine transporter-like permease